MSPNAGPAHGAEVARPSGQGSPSRGIGYAAGVLAALGFSFKAVFVKAALNAGADALTVLALRMGFSLPIFLALALWTGRAGISRRDAVALVALGFLGYYLSSLLDMLGLEHISAGLERVVLFTYPTLTVIFATLLGRERLTGRLALALLISYAGLVVAVSAEIEHEGSTPGLFTGIAWVLGSALSYALYLTLSSGLVTRLGSLRMTAYATTVAAFFALSHFALARPLSRLVLPAPVYGYAVGLALFSTALPIALQAEAVRRVGAGHAASIGALGPVMTLGLAGLFLGEPTSGRQLVGSLLVIAGVMLLVRRPRA